MSTTTESRDEAIREAKRYVRDIVRNDWSFEFSTKPGAPPPIYPTNPEPDEVLEWRLREYDSSGSEFEPQLSPISPVRNGTGLTSSSTSASGRRADRRRKRRRQLEEEMNWNDGLRTWIERRDAWTGAKSRGQQIRIAEQTMSSATTPPTTTTTTTELRPTAHPLIPNSNTTGEETQITPVGLGEVQSPSNLATKAQTALNLTEKDNDELDGSQFHEEVDRKPSTETNLTEPDTINTTDNNNSNILKPSLSSSTNTSAPTSTESDEELFVDPLIPVVPSLIATSNPIRASITPAMYPSIYSKVVIQGLTPTVPINLADMTKAMVQGWKADGQWPPKPTSIVLPNDAIVRRNDNTVKHPDTPATINNTPGTTMGGAAGDKAPSSPESKRRSGIASTVRKVLHFSGFHPHPFHRRGSSSQNNHAPEDHAATTCTGGDGSNAPGISPEQSQHH